MTAFNELTKELQDDPKKAQAWHIELVESFYNAIDPNDLAHKDALSVANEAASTFMKRVFGIETEEETQ